MGNFGGASIGKHLFTTIVDNIEKESTMLEFGSGDATKEFAKLYNVYSVEDNIRWVNHARNAKYIHAPQRNYVGSNNISYMWYDLEILKNNLPDKYDFILVDGPKGGYGKPARIGFEHNINMFDINVPMFFDDTQRPFEFEQADRISKLVNKELITVDYNDKNGCKFSYFI